MYTCVALLSLGLSFSGYLIHISIWQRVQIKLKPIPVCSILIYSINVCVHSFDGFEMYVYYMNAIINFFFLFCIDFWIHLDQIYVQVESYPRHTRDTLGKIYTRGKRSFFGFIVHTNKVILIREKDDKPKQKTVFIPDVFELLACTAVLYLFCFVVYYDYRFT